MNQPRGAGAQPPKKRADAWLADTFEHADPIVAQFMARHNALLERVTVLEKALERVIDIEGTDSLVAAIAREALDA